jgi:hypothetical protein
MFKINEIVFDSANKEFVKLTNGKAELDGSNFVPTEGIALRVIDILKSGKPQIAFTYRSVDPSKLSALTKPSDADHFKRVMNSENFLGKKDEHFQYIGRV